MRFGEIKFRGTHHVTIRGVPKNKFHSPLSQCSSGIVQVSFQTLYIKE